MEKATLPDEATEAITTSPMILSIQDLNAIVETRDPGTAAIQYTTFYLFTGIDVAFLAKYPRQRCKYPSRTTLPHSNVCRITLFSPSRPGRWS